MAAVREISGCLLSCSKSHPSLSQLLFLRRMTSKIFVKGTQYKLLVALNRIHDATYFLKYFKLWRGLAFSTTEEELVEAFSQYGRVLKADIILNKAKNRSKGFGYVTFAKEEGARKAQIGMNGKILHGRVLYVDMQSPNKQKKSFSEVATNVETR